MTAHINQCGLCLKTSNLRDSHLLPAALYNLVRDPSGGANPNPVLVTGGRSFTSSKQVTAHFLCSNCEERFSRNGESYVLSQCARLNGRFGLRQLLQTVAAPLLEDGPYKCYEVTSLLGDKTEQYLYFAASVFWRAGARSWMLQGKPVSQIALGKYQEHLRFYLLGEAGFPSNARLFVNVSNDQRIDFVLPPCTARVKGVWRHKFYIPGILFILFLGGEVPEKHDDLALNSSQGRFMWLCPWQEDSLFHGFAALVKRSKPSASLRRRSSG